MSFLDGIKNFLQMINDNWTTIVVIIALIISIGKKVKDFLAKSDEEKLEIAKQQIKEITLKLITDAEVDYETWSKAGSIKRSQVIEEIYEKFPILSKIVDQEAIIAFIDETIDAALEELRPIVSENKDTEEAAVEGETSVESEVTEEVA